MDKNDNFKSNVLSEPSKKENKKSRCGCCKKRLVLTECTCGVLFCPTHIAPGSHCCSRILKRNESSLGEIPGFSIKATGAFPKIQYI